MKKALPLIIVTLAEATIGIFVKLVDGEVPVFTLNFYRVFFAAIFIGAAMLALNKQFWKFPRKNTRDILIIGALIATQTSLFNLALTLTTVANAVIFWSIAPFFVFVFSWLFIGEKAHKHHVAIFLLALIGLFIAEPFGGGNVSGNIVALITGVIYAGAITFMRSEGLTESSNDVFWFMTIAALYLLPAPFIFGTGNLFQISAYSLFGLSVPTVVWVLGLGVISTGVAYFFISRVLKHISANIYSLVDVIVSPIIAGILAYLIFREVPSIHVVYGGALLLGAGFWLTRTMTVSKKHYYREGEAGSVK